MGAVLYEMATGRQAFGANTVALIFEKNSQFRPTPADYFKSRASATALCVVLKIKEN